MCLSCVFSFCDVFMSPSATAPSLAVPGIDAAAASVQLLLESPVMLEGELAAVQGSSGLRTQTFGLHYISGAPGALEAALHELCAAVEAAVRNGCEAPTRVLSIQCCPC